MDAKESAEVLAETFYLEDFESEDNTDHRQIRNLATQVNGNHDGKHDPPFTIKELIESVESFNPKETPGSRWSHRRHLQPRDPKRAPASPVDRPQMPRTWLLPHHLEGGHCGCPPKIRKRGQNQSQIV